MKKTTVFLALALLVASVSAFAGSTPKNEQEQTGIVTPEVATGMMRIYRYTYDKDMNILVCPRGMEYEHDFRTDVAKCQNEKRENQWRKMENYVPVGKKFVGFKSVSQGSSHALEIYWK